MPELTPFAALRFTHAAGDLSLLLAPPYDVIDPDAAAELRARSAFNSVRLILPEGSETERYVHAAQTLREWTSSGILLRDPEPRAYVYRQSFETDGRPRERLAVFAALRLVPLDTGEVLPHEHTHAGPKKDRLALTLATRTQLSPVFMLAPDSDGSLYASERATLQQPAVAGAFTPDGVRHDLYDAHGRAADELLAAASIDPLLIADGHHRYETALAVSDLLGDNVKAAYMLVCVVSQEDPGLEVRPTHRILLRPPRGHGTADSFDWSSALADTFELQPMESMQAAELERAAAHGPSGAFIVAPGDGGGFLRAIPRSDSLRRAGIPPERARIAPVIFDELVLRRFYEVGADEATSEGILGYSRSPAPAAAAERGACGFILPPVSLRDVWQTAALGGRLPPKSTYFEPKMPSGLLFRPL